MAEPSVLEEHVHLRRPWPAIVTLLNEARHEAGKGPIGFQNPVFYAHPDAFNDITVRSNPGCGYGRVFSVSLVGTWSPVWELRYTQS